MKTEINIDDLFKIKVKDFSERNDRREVIKLLIMLKLARKYNNLKQWIKIHAEHPVSCNKESRVATILFENIKEKEVYAYEIQEGYAEKWFNEITSFYKDWDKEISNMFAKKATMIPIPTKNLSDDLTILSKQLDDFIV